MKNIIIILSTTLALYGAHDTNFDEDQIPGVVQNDREKPVREHVFSRQVSRNAFPDSDEEVSTPSKGSLTVELSRAAEAVSELTAAPKKDRSCCVLL